MKKLFCACLCLLLAMPAGCSTPTVQSETYFYFDTVVTLTACCDKAVLQGGFDLCGEYEALFSRTKEGSDVWRINHTDGPVSVDPRTAELVRKALFYGDLSGGRLDITVAPITDLYNFADGVIPTAEAVAPLLSLVDYRRVRVEGNTVDAGGCAVDLGAVAKGYIADKLQAYFVANGVTDAVINLGGNLWLMGRRNDKATIKRPFAADSCLTVNGTDMTLATSGIDQRFVEHDGVVFSHILDPTTGFGVQNELAQVTVIGQNSTDADALSTVCMLCGKEKGLALINATPHTEAVFVGKDGTISLSDGLHEKNGAVSFTK